jgi:RNA polymerase sigma-70 factor (ECF subfamily)
MEESSNLLLQAADADRKLMERIRSGDKAACAECIELHSPAIYRLALRLMKNPDEAEDVVQETFLSAFRGISRFDGRSTLRTWLFRIAWNAAMMRLRRKEPDFLSVEDASEPETGAPVPKELFDWCCLPEAELEKKEVRAELERAIGSLPELLRAAFIMREMEGLTTGEAATALGVSEDVVKTRLHRARLQLRENLAEFFASTMDMPRE